MEKPDPVQDASSESSVRIEDFFRLLAQELENYGLTVFEALLIIGELVVTLLGAALTSGLGLMFKAASMGLTFSYLNIAIDDLLKHYP